MSIREHHNRIRSMRERKLGGFIVLVFFIFLVFILWNWIETCYRRRQLFDLYFPTTIQGLSVGANVTIDGRKIGQVESVRLRSLSHELAFRNYAVVTVYADMRELWNLPGSIDDAAFKEAVDKQIEYGLRARLRLPSLISDGLCVEFFYDRGKPAFFVDDPQCENIEIPTYSGSLSQYIDEINARISEYKLRELSEKLLHAENTIRHLNEILNQTDFKTFNRKILSETAELREILTAESLSDKLNELDKTMKNFADALKNKNRNVDSLFETASTQLSLFSEKIEILNARLKAADKLSPETLLKIKTELNNYRDALHSWNEQLQHLVSPAK